MGIFSLGAMLVAALIVIAIMSLTGDYMIFMPGLLQGAWLTLQITVARLCAGGRHGDARRAVRNSMGPRRCAGSPSRYVEFFRGTSALVQLFWLFFVLPHFGISTRALHGRRAGLGLNVGAYGAEVVRGAIQGVAARPVGSDDRAEHDALAGAAAHHPAAGFRRHDPALGQPVHRADEIDRAGLADHHERPAFKAQQMNDRRHSRPSRSSPWRC